MLKTDPSNMRLVCSLARMLLDNAEQANGFYCVSVHKCVDGKRMPFEAANEGWPCSSLTQIRCTSVYVVRAPRDNPFFIGPKAETGTCAGTPPASCSPEDDKRWSTTKSLRGGGGVRQLAEMNQE
eukprot:726156-Pleurochrysis_carterae.AAC.1